MLQKTDYNETYFNGAEGGYSNYSENTYVSENHEQLSLKINEKLTANGISLVGKRILVVGCAYGFLVKYLISRGADAYGIDISSYALSQAPIEISNRLMLGDVSIPQTFADAKNLAGLRQNQRFDVIVDEDMYCCLTDSEAISFRSAAISASNLFIHIITLGSNLSQWYNYKTIEEWKSLTGQSPKEKFYSRFNWIEG